MDASLHSLHAPVAAKQQAAALMTENPRQTEILSRFTEWIFIKAEVYNRNFLGLCMLACKSILPVGCVSSPERNTWPLPPPGQLLPGQASDAL